MIRQKLSKIQSLAKYNLPAKYKEIELSKDFPPEVKYALEKCVIKGLQEALLVPFDETYCVQIAQIIKRTYDSFVPQYDQDMDILNEWKLEKMGIEITEDPPQILIVMGMIHQGHKKTKYLLPISVTSEVAKAFCLKIHKKHLEIKDKWEKMIELGGKNDISGSW